VEQKTIQALFTAVPAANHFNKTTNNHSSKRICIFLTKFFHEFVYIKNLIS
jgi:hypothetical protein